MRVNARETLDVFTLIVLAIFYREHYLQAVPLKKGMLMCVDNYRALHGRMGYVSRVGKQQSPSLRLLTRRSCMHSYGQPIPECSKSCFYRHREHQDSRL